jgi:dihydrofolate synthase/folylpolyglutamate synthase
VALAAVTAFLGRPLSSDVVEQGFRRVRFPGRLEVLGHMPLVVVDGAHNAAGAGALSDALVEGFHVTGTSVVVIGMLQGREPAEILGPLAAAGISTVICVEPASPRALDATFIEKAARDLELTVSVAPSITDGVERAYQLAGDDGLVLVTGSLYVVGDARLALLGMIGQEEST